MYIPYPKYYVPHPNLTYYVPYPNYYVPHPNYYVPYPKYYVPYPNYYVPYPKYYVPYPKCYVPYLKYYVPYPIYYVTFTCDPPPVDTQLARPLPPGVVKCARVTMEVPCTVKLGVYHISVDCSAPEMPRANPRLKLQTPCDA